MGYSEPKKVICRSTGEVVGSNYVPVKTNGQKGVSGAFNGLFGRAGEPAARQMALENHYATIARMKRPPGLYMAA